MEKRNRIKELQRYLKNKQIQAALIEDRKNRQYLTWADIWEGSLLVTEDKAYLLVDFRYYEMANRYVKDCEVCLSNDINQSLKELLISERISCLMIEKTIITMRRFIELRDIFNHGTILQQVCANQIVKEFRKIKDAYELSCIKKAQEITDAAYEYILENVHVGMMESEIRIKLGAFMIRNGSEGFDIGYIASSGMKTAMPHGGIGDKVLERGDLVMIDFGAKIDGYVSDCTRTFAIKSVTEEQKLVYEVVKTAQKKAIEFIEIGRSGKEIDAVARILISEAGYNGCFGHGLGHSVGLDGHEFPLFNEQCEECMSAGVVMTVEPGIYLKNKFGVRIEDMGVVTENGFYDFTKCTKDLQIVG